MVRLLGQGGGRMVFRVQKTEPEAPVKSQGNQEGAFLPEGGWVLSGHKASLGSAANPRA